ncbi:hypothetical protein BCR32DRAFT_328144, partial [Anaeromyces robustus]
YKSSSNNDYDFFKTDTNDRNTYTSKYSTDKYTSKYSSGSTYQNNDSSYKRVYKLGSDRNDRSTERKYDYSSKYSSPTSSSNDKETYSIYTKYLQNEDKKDSLFSSSNDYGINIHQLRRLLLLRLINGQVQQIQIQINIQHMMMIEEIDLMMKEKNRFDDLRNRFEDNKYGSSSNLFDDKPEKPSWKTSLFQERSRSETRFNENDNRGKTPAQILKELRERNLENVKMKKEAKEAKEAKLNDDDDDDINNNNDNKIKTKVETKIETKKVNTINDDDDSSEDLNVDKIEEDDDDIPLNILEGGGSDIKKNGKINKKKDIIKPKIKKIGSKASMANIKGNANNKNNETNSISSGSSSGNSKNKSDNKPEIPNSPIKEGVPRSSSTGSLSLTKHASLIPPAVPSPLINQIKPLPTAIQMPVMGQQIIAASPLVPSVMVAPSTPVMQPVMVPQFTQQFQPIFVNPIQQPIISSPKLGSKPASSKKAAKRRRLNV